MLNLCLFTQGEILSHLQLSPSEGRLKGKAFAKCSRLNFHVLQLTTSSCFKTVPAYMPTYHNRGKILLNNKLISKLWWGFFLHESAFESLESVMPEF